MKSNEEGENSDRIPSLSNMNPNDFAISVTTIDGQHYSIGDSDTQFTVQSCCNPVAYLISLAKFGSNYVHKYVGVDPADHTVKHKVKADPTDENP